MGYLGGADLPGARLTCSGNDDSIVDDPTMDPGREILQVGDQHSDERTHHFFMGKLALFFMAIFTGHVSHYQRVICKSVNKSSIFCSYSWFIRKLSAVIP